MSGVMFGWVGLDVKAQMDMCFPDDAELAELTDGMFDKYDEGDLDGMTEQIKKMTVRYMAGFQDCNDDEDVMQALEAMNDRTAPFYAQDDW